jgi:hypothetical protein
MTQNVPAFAIVWARPRAPAERRFAARRHERAAGNASAGAGPNGAGYQPSAVHLTGEDLLRGSHWT